MLVRGPSDLSQLRAKLPVPPGLTGTWAAAKVDHPGHFDFGPATIEVVMWLPAGEPGDGGAEQTWRDLARLLGPEGGPATVAMSRLAVAALVPDRVTELVARNGHVEVRGPAYPAMRLEGPGFARGRAVRIAGGVLAAVTSVGA